MIDHPAVWAAASGNSNLLGGADLLQLLVMAFGGALVVGNGLALIRSRRPAAAAAGETETETKTETETVQPPLGRSLVMILIGLVAVIWAIATLTA